MGFCSASELEASPHSGRPLWPENIVLLCLIHRLVRSEIPWEVKISINDPEFSFEYEYLLGDKGGQNTKKNT